MSPTESSIEPIGESYHDRPDAHHVHERIRDGEDIHVGIHEDEDTDIVTASLKTVDLMAAKLKKVIEDRHLAEPGFDEIDCMDVSGQLCTHYDKVRAELAARRDELTNKIGHEHLHRALAGLKNRVEASDNGHLARGILHL